MASAYVEFVQSLFFNSYRQFKNDVVKIFYLKEEIYSVVNNPYCLLGRR